MSTPLEIRRVIPRRFWYFMAWGWAAAFGGGVTLVVTLLVASTDDLTRFQQFNSVWFGVIGVQAMTFGLRRLLRNRGLLEQDVSLRLDDEGIAVRHGSLGEDVGWGRLAWEDLSAIVVRSRTIGPPLLAEDTVKPVMFFVARDESAIQIDRIAAYDAAKGVSLGLSPSAAVMSMIMSDQGPERVSQIEDWLTQHRPAVLFQASTSPVH